VFNHEEDVQERGDDFHRGCVISSTSIRNSSPYTQVDSQGGAIDFLLTCSPTEGAVLALPDGASRKDLSYRHHIQAYARGHAISWFEHVYGTLGLESEAGPLYLVTGHDKCHNWCVASYTNAPVEAEMSLIFAPTVDADGASRYTYWYSGNMDARTSTPGQNRFANQCVFIRGYKLTLCKSLIEKIFGGRVKVSDIVPPNPDTGGLGPTPGTRTLNLWSPWFVGGSPGGHQHQLAEPQDPAPGPRIAVDSFPQLSEVSFLINRNPFHSDYLF
jgi:hypothetical protein